MHCTPTWDGANEWGRAVVQKQVLCAQMYVEHSSINTHRLGEGQGYVLG